MSLEVIAYEVFESGRREAVAVVLATNAGDACITYLNAEGFEARDVGDGVIVDAEAPRVYAIRGPSDLTVAQIGQYEADGALVSRRAGLRARILRLEHDADAVLARLVATDFMGRDGCGHSQDGSCGACTIPDPG